MSAKLPSLETNRQALAADRRMRDPRLKELYLDGRSTEFVLFRECDL